LLIVLNEIPPGNNEVSLLAFLHSFHRFIAKILYATLPKITCALLENSENVLMHAT
jgi:hypothetical protein